MNVFDNITVTKISHVFSPIYAEPISYRMINRPDYGISFAVDGEILYNHNGKIIKSDSAHAVILPKNATYTFTCYKPGKFTLINFDCLGDPGIDDFISIRIKDCNRYIQDHRTLEKLDLFKTPCNHAEFMQVFYGMIARLQHEMMQKTPYPVLRPAINCISNRLNETELSSDDIAECTGLSEVYFRKLFKSVYGVTPKQYLQQARIDKAKTMLETGNISVTTVAAECGYASIYHFSRVFKGKTGYSPVEYREKFKRLFL